MFYVFVQTGRFVSYQVGNPENRLSRAAAQKLLFVFTYMFWNNQNIFAL